MKTTKALLVLMLIAVPAFAQSGSSSQPSISPSQVYLWNGTASTVNFSITGNKCGDPLNDSLRPDYSNTYTCDGADFFNIALATKMQDGSVIEKRYSLVPTKRYQLFANAQGAFDVAELQAR